MKLNDIINMTGSDLNSMTKAELVAINNKLNSIVANRLKNLTKDQLNESSPAYYLAKDYGLLNPQPISETLTIQQLRKQVVRKKNFVSKKTSTVTGAKRNYKKVTGQYFTEERDMTFDDYIKALTSLKEKYAAEIESSVLSSDQINDELKRVLARKDSFHWTDLYDKAIGEIKTKYGEEIDAFEREFNDRKEIQP